MKQINYLYPQQGMSVTEVPEPQIKKPNEVKVKIEYAAICGSDIHILNGAFDYIFKMFGYPEGAPIPLGHEAAGTVVEVGEEVTNVKVGDKVTFNNAQGCGKCHFCRNGMENMCTSQITGFGGMCEYSVIPDSNAYVIPEGITTRQACITEPISIAMGAIDRANIKPGESVAIIGGGPIGMLVLQLVRMQGACPIALFDIVEEKLEIAKKLGADIALDSKAEDSFDKAMAATDGLGYDKVIECSGTTKVLDMAMNLLSKNGHLVIASAYAGGSKMEIDLDSFFMKNLSIAATYCSANQFEHSVKMLNRIDFDNTITAEFPFDEYEKGFEAHKSGKNVKVIFKVSE